MSSSMYVLHTSAKDSGAASGNGEQFSDSELGDLFFRGCYSYYILKAEE